MTKSERKILRKIHGPVKTPDAAWRLRNNEEVDRIIRKQNIVRQIKATWMVWAYTKNGRTLNNKEDNQLDANIIKQAKRKT
jgi:hypothetical protein